MDTTIPQPTVIPSPINNVPHTREIPRSINAQPTPPELPNENKQKKAPVWHIFVIGILGGLTLLAGVIKAQPAKIISPIPTITPTQEIIHVVDAQSPTPIITQPIASPSATITPSPTDARGCAYNGTLNCMQDNNGISVCSFKTQNYSCK